MFHFVCNNEPLLRYCSPPVHAAPPMFSDAEPSDAELIEAVRQRDVNAYGTLIERHAGRVRGFVALRAPLANVIDEVSHEAFVFAYRNLDRFTSGSFSAWVCEIARQILRSEQQRFRRQEENEARYTEHILAEHSFRAADTPDERNMEALEGCLQKLPGRMRELIQMRYAGSLTSDEIAEQLQQSAAWVRTSLFRIRQQLRVCLDSSR